MVIVIMMWLYYYASGYSYTWLALGKAEFSRLIQQTCSSLEHGAYKAELNTLHASYSCGGSGCVPSLFAYIFTLTTGHPEIFVVRINFCLV